MSSSVLPPVGKRLIDYYRSCDLVWINLFMLLRAGSEAAASAGLWSHIRSEQYGPLYAGDIAPVINASTVSEIRVSLMALIDDGQLRKQKGNAMREWVVRNHGEQKTVPLMLALLRLCADRVPLPSDLVNPLRTPLTEEEIASPIC